MSKYKQKIELLKGYCIIPIKPKVDYEEYIKNLENETTCELPPDYLEFILNYSGFAFNNVVYNFFNSYEESDEQLLSVCFGMLPGNGYDLIRNYHTFKDRIPPNFLPIACDAFGNLVCLSVHGEDKGCVYFWQHDAEETIGEKLSKYPEDIHLVSKFFYEFINSLEKYEEDDDE
ncbi:putative glucan synthasis protein [Rivularia sp. PCC 7116]|uniref:SMI1/KNR4 family protein n=1 Tax=Rivularia sp. PCC 7116 TaxID=373994 RepID=UPI00029EC514|nr:SMI1/KNR4 family protein [Rivularia sp. PCC 7116]AFY58994.1 putative glucan synthasis protein [Rivularia sp. PCC 7116]